MVASWDLCKPCGDLTAFSSPWGHCKPCDFFSTSHYTFFGYRNTTTTPQMHRKVIVRWPWGEIWFLPGLRCLETLMAALQRPYGDLATALRRIFGSCNNREGAIRSPYGSLPVSLWSPYGFWSYKSYNCCDHYYHSQQDLMIFKITFTNRKLKNCTAKYGGSKIFDQRISRDIFQVLLAQLSASYAPELKTIFCITTKQTSSWWITPIIILS